jgi:hypothetical protein
MWGVLADALTRFLPERRNILQLSFALDDPARLQSLLAGAGFRDISVQRETREDAMESFDEYWEPIEAGIGLMPQAYLALPDRDRRSVRDGVRARLSQLESNGKLLMSVEVLIGSGRA